MRPTEIRNRPPIPRNRVGAVLPDLGGWTEIVAEGKTDGVEVVVGIVVGVTVGVTVGVKGAMVGVEIGILVGVNEAEGVDSPKTASPLLRTIKVRLISIGFPFLSNPLTLI